MFNKYSYRIEIEGMKCNNCALHVKNALNSIKGVKKVEIDLENKTADVKTSTELDEYLVKTKIEEAGYRFINQKSV